VNDAIITRLECKFPSGSPPGPPNEHRWILSGRELISLPDILTDK
jgi:hypothetical protein